MQVSDLRVALFSGNYAMTVDGANKALNRLVDYLLRQGTTVRVYSPTIPNPPFEPKGELVSLPSVAIPGRSEYRVPTWLGSRVRADLEAFAPDIVHISSPDFAAREAARWARDRSIPVVASVHTRFETYPRYYGLGFLEPALEAWLRSYRPDELFDSDGRPRPETIAVAPTILRRGASWSAARRCSTRR